jgi:hypothetical protein
MTPTERALAARCLIEAAETFSNHGCNDLRLPNTDENWFLIEAMEDWAKIDKPDRRSRPPPWKDIVTEDWLMMKYLASRLEADE